MTDIDRSPEGSPEAHPGQSSPGVRAGRSPPVARDIGSRPGRCHGAHSEVMQNGRRKK